MKKHLVRSLVIAVLATLTFLIVKPSTVHSTHVEALQGTKTTQTVQSTPEVPKAPETAPTQAVEPKVDIVTLNPQGCDQNTQWIWEDGSCHNKAVAQNNQQPVVTQRGAPNCDVLREKLLALGVGGGEIDSAITLAQRESSCNEYAQNSGGACGYFQSLPCGKWGMPGSDSYLPGAIGYVRARYGDYNNALAHSYSFNWY